MIKIPTWVVFIVCTWLYSPLLPSYSWMWPELGQLSDWIFLPCPLCAIPLLSTIFAGIMNGLTGEELATSRERDRAGYNHKRIKYGCAGSPRQEVAFPSENGLREIFWIQRGWPTEYTRTRIHTHPSSLSFSLSPPYPSLLSFFLSPPSVLDCRRIHKRSVTQT